MIDTIDSPDARSYTTLEHKAQNPLATLNVSYKAVVNNVERQDHELTI